MVKVPAWSILPIIAFRDALCITHNPVDGTLSQGREGPAIRRMSHHAANPSRHNPERGIMVLTAHEVNDRSRRQSWVHPSPWGDQRPFSGKIRSSISGAFAVSSLVCAVLRCWSSAGVSPAWQLGRSSQELSERWWSCSRRGLAGDREVTDANRPLDRELVAARIMYPVSTWVGGPESVFRFTRAGWERPEE